MNTMSALNFSCAAIEFGLMVYGIVTNGGWWIAALCSCAVCLCMGFVFLDR